jgi:hypothetical protein
MTIGLLIALASPLALAAQETKPVSDVDRLRLEIRRMQAQAIDRDLSIAQLLAKNATCRAALLGGDKKATDSCLDQTPEPEAPAVKVPAPGAPPAKPVDKPPAK